MPLVFWMFGRTLRALYATGRLLADWKVVRRLPWSYLRTLPRRDAWVAVVFGGLVVSSAATLTVAVAPFASVRAVAFAVALGSGFTGLASSWIRRLAHR